MSRVMQWADFHLGDDNRSLLGLTQTAKPSRRDRWLSNPGLRAVVDKSQTEPSPSPRPAPDSTLLARASWSVCCSSLLIGGRGSAAPGRAVGSWPGGGGAQPSLPQTGADKRFSTLAQKGKKNAGRPPRRHQRHRGCPALGVPRPGLAGPHLPTDAHRGAAQPQPPGPLLQHVHRLQRDRLALLLHHLRLRLPLRLRIAAVRRGARRTTGTNAIRPPSCKTAGIRRHG